MLKRITIALLLESLLVGCGSGTAQDSQESPNQGNVSEMSTNSEPLNPLTLLSVTIAGNLSSTPEIEIDQLPVSVSELKIADQVVGEGEFVVASSTVLAHYIGIGGTTGKVFDSSWSRGAPIEFGLNQVIKGWTQGLTGMKIGGRRLLIIPGDLAYGSNPPPGSGIEPNETLIFVVDLVDFK